MSTEDNIAKLMVMFQELGLYHHSRGRKVEIKEKFMDTWAKEFNIVSKGELLTQWFESWSELRPVGTDGVTEDDLTFSDLAEMDLDGEGEYIIDLHSHMWESVGDDAPDGF